MDVLGRMGQNMRRGLTKMKSQPSSVSSITSIALVSIGPNLPVGREMAGSSMSKIMHCSLGIVKNTFHPPNPCK